MKKIFGWHFVGATLRDGSPIPADNRWLRHTGELKMCQSGLHWSKTPWEALHYAPGNTLCRVEIRGATIYDTDKAVSAQRCIRQRQDITELLRQFARQQALSVIHLWAAPDVVREYLETGNESLRAAAYAASDAAIVAAYAARAAAYVASDAAIVARDAAYVARDAAIVAARDAAIVAAIDAAIVAARAAAYAARDAARAASYAAIEAARDFNNMVYAAFGLDERGKNNECD